MSRLTFGRAILGIAIGAIAAFLITNRVNSSQTDNGNAKAHATAKVADQFSKIPVAFVENQGQTDSHVRYFARGPQYAFYLTQNEVVFAMSKERKQAVLADYSSTADQVTLGLRFLGSNPDSIVDGSNRTSGNVNYFRGNDRAEWHTNVPAFAQVVYHDLWPGIDLQLREIGGTLKYEFHVRPGARVKDIRLQYRGVSGIAIDRTKGLQIETAVGTLRDAAPISFQNIDGRRVPVESSFLLEDEPSAYGFQIGEGYQHDQELIIDPGVEYSTFLGGASHEIAAGIAVDGAGNSYIVGWTQSPDYPTTSGAFDRTGAASNSLEAFVAKLNPAGTALLYSTFIGGSNFEWGRAIAIDAAGNAYIAGQTKSSDFPTTSNAFDRTFNVLNCPRCGVDNYDAFVTKLNPTGSALVYSTYLGGASDIDDALAIAVDASGSAYVAGETGSAEFPVTTGAFSRTRGGAYDAFITKFNPSGSALVYSTFIGGSQVDFPARIRLDSSNNAYVLGNTSSPDFPTTPGVFSPTNNGGFDAFVLKLNAAGSNLLYSTLLGGLGMESAGGLAIDSGGNAYVSGGTASANFPTTPGAFQTVSLSGGGGAFVTKLNPTATTLVYSTFLGDAGASTIGLTPAGNVWVAGGTSSQSFPVTPDAYQSFYHPGGPVSGSADAFLTQLNAAGSAIVYSTYLGGIDPDYATDLGLDSPGNVYIAGETMSADFPVTATAVDRTFGGRLDVFWGDAFITKFALNLGPPGTPPLPTVATVFPGGVEGVGGNATPVTVTLSGGAQGTGAIVSLVSSNPAVFSVPGSLVIPKGAQTGTINAATAVVAVNTPVTITASYNNSSKTAVFTVLPVPPSASLLSIGMFPNVITGGTPALAILAISSPASAEGFTAALSSNNPVATVPSTVTVAAGQTNVSFAIPTSVVTASTGLTIFATAGGRTAIGTLTVNPAAPPPPTTVTLSVSATGRNGERVTSSPSGINVPVGSSMQASFASGTGVTLSVSNGRDAVWSGACSSGGSKTKTCSFALNGNASVTANVQ